MAKLLFIQSKAPHGSLFGQEGLDAILMGTAFAECNVLLVEDGIYQVLKAQDTRELGTKDYSVTYKALPDYGVSTIYCSERHLLARGLTPDDLVVPVEPLGNDAIKQLMADHTAILGF